MTQPTVDTEHAHSATITVLVNNKPVTFSEKHVTGLQIKQTAINQGVAIELSFPLFQVKGHDHLDPVADDARVTLNAKDEFRAVATDDSSAF